MESLLRWLRQLHEKMTLVTCARIIAFVMLILFLLLMNFYSKTASASAALRVIALYPGHSDNITALGAADMLVGLSENDDADLLPELPRFSLRTGAEALLALQPDIVLMRTLVTKLNPTLEQILTQAGVRVVMLDPPGWDNFPDYLRQLAEILGLDPESGVTRLNELRESIAVRAREALAAQGDAPAPRVFLETTAKELHTCSPDSWAAHLIALAGGINAASEAVPQRKGSTIAPWGLERILKLLDDSLDVYIIQQGAMNASTLEDLKARPWASALTNTKLVAAPEGLLSRPSLLGLERGGDLLLGIFYGQRSR